MKRIGLIAFAVTLGLAGAARAQVNFNVYGDLDYRLERRGATVDTFAAPRLDFLPSAAVDRLSFLAEVVFEAGEGNDFSGDVERIEVAWIFADWLRLRAGRFHTALVYYNDAFHHGLFFQLPVMRAGWLDFEDSGGLIPAHSVGLHLDGRLPIGDGALRYDLELANGRGLTLVTVQSARDVAREKEVNLRLRYEPAFLPGLLFGVNALYDHIPGNADPALAAGPIPEMTEWIFGAHAAYQEGPFRFIAEAAAFLHQRRDGARSYSSQAALLEAGYTVRAATPYAQLSWVNLESADPFYANSPAAMDGSNSSLLAGLKWTVNDHLALKCELAHRFEAAGADLNSLAVQAAFAF